jgi:hypothetical protein
MTLRRAAPSQWVVPGRGSYVGGRRLRHRLPCDARSEVASQNSLRSLRSLRSDSCDESEGRSALARADFGPALLGAAQIAPAGHRPPRMPRLCSFDQARRWRKGACGQAGVRLEAPSSAGFAARARSAPRELTCRGCLSAVNEVNAASSRDGAVNASSAGQPKAASYEAPRPARTQLCSITNCPTTGRLRTEFNRTCPPRCSAPTTARNDLRSRSRRMTPRPTPAPA